MIKKILLFNRGIIRQMTPLMFAIGCAFTAMFGAFILIGRVPVIELSEHPVWQGYLFLWGGFVLLILFAIDGLIFPIIKLFKPYKHKTLKDRIVLEGKVDD